MAGDTRHAISALPKQGRGRTDMETITHRARDFRLKSLQLAPESFGITYEMEMAKGPDYWSNRVTNPKATTFIAYRSNATKFGDGVEDHIQECLGAEWLGSIILLGPKSGIAKFSANTSPWVVMDQASEDLENLTREAKPARHYLINAMFVMPAARGLGVGKALVNSALDHAVKQTKESNFETMRCTIFTDKDNDSARELYLKSGFEIVGEEMFRPEKGKHRMSIEMELTRFVGKA